MRFATAVIAIAGLVTFASAGTLERRQYPSCANPCLASADLGSCASDDLNCLCNSAAFVTSTSECIAKACSPEDTAAASTVAEALCSSVGVNLSTLVPSAPSSGTASAPATSSTGSAGGSSAGGATTPASTHTTSGSSRPSSAASSGTSSASAPASSTTAPSTPGGAMANGVNTLVVLGALGLGAFVL